MLRVIHRLLDRDRRRLEKRLQLALSAGKMAAWEANLRDGKTWWAPEMFGLHGLAPDAGVPADYYALVHPEDRERLRDVIEESRRSCSDHSVQYRVLWPDGSVHWVEGTGTTICDDAEQPELMTGVCVNIDARKEEETDLQFLAQASAELAALSDYETTMQRIARLAVPHFADWCAVDMLEEGGRFRRVAVAHVDPEKVKLAMELHERYPPDPRAAGGAWHIVRTGKPELVPVITSEMLDSSIEDPQELEAIRSLGLHSYMGLPLTAGGAVRGVISFITSESRRVFSGRDLVHATDLASRAAVAIRNAELVDALKRSDAAKDVFLATLAHELRNPLAPIVNSLALLARAEQPADALPHALPILQRQTAHLTRLVDDLLDIARIGSQKVELRRRVVDLREVLRAALEGSQPVVDAKRHSLAVSLPGEPATVDGDPLRLAQVFSNLVNNAAKYTPAGGRIEVQMAATDDGVTVDVIDNGCGMPPELLPRIFDVFVQAPDASQAGSQGLGIGLYLVKGLVELHHGSVTAQSAGPTRGSRFTVRLPHVRRPPEQPEASTAAKASQARTVLVVDDNVDAAQTLAELLAMMGHASFTAPNGTAALAKVHELRPDVVLLDIGLPDMDGYEVARRIRAEAAPQPRLVALTGWGQSEDKRKAAEAGFDMHWTKPVDPAKLDEL